MTEPFVDARDDDSEPFIREVPDVAWAVFNRWRDALLAGDFHAFRLAMRLGVHRHYPNHPERLFEAIGEHLYDYNNNLDWKIPDADRADIQRTIFGTEHEYHVRAVLHATSTWDCDGEEYADRRREARIAAGCGTRWDLARAPPADD